MFRKWPYRALLAVAVAFSAFRLVADVSWFDDLRRQVWWVGTGILVSEIVLTLGLIGMLLPTGRHTLREIRSTKLRDIDWNGLSVNLRKSQAFWLAFWVSLVGGVGDGATLIAAIVVVAPVDAWGLMLLPLADIWSTFVIRGVIYTKVMKEKSVN
jgi:hypothetical protein